MTVAEQIRSSLARKELTDRRSGKCYGSVTISLGIALFIPKDGSVGLIHRADQALYAAKDGGRNRVVADDCPTASAA